ncbi:MAG: hypothetical protein VB023_11605 [Oscillibacter sp.]|nr:hypothetical protein [Oscillibacter sp.]
MAADERENLELRGEVNADYMQFSPQIDFSDRHVSMNGTDRVRKKNKTGSANLSVIYRQTRARMAEGLFRAANEDKSK